MVSALSLQPSKDFPCPGCHHLTSLFPQCFFSHLQTTWKGLGMRVEKRVKILIVPCSCVWAVREIREPLLSRPLWPGYKSEQLRRHDAGNTQSTLWLPDGRPLLSLPSSQLSPCPPQLTPAHGCKLVQGALREARGQALPSAAPCSQSSPRTLQSGVRGPAGKNHAFVKQSFVGFAFSGVTLLPDWDKQSQGKPQGTVALLLF